MLIMPLAILLLSSTIVVGASSQSLQPIFAHGLDFKITKNLSNNAGFSSQQQVVVSGNNVYVVWRDDTSGNSDVLFKRSTDGGKTFGSTKNLSNNAGESRSPQIAASGNNVYVVWVDRTSGNSADILFKRSTDGGKTFGSTKNLSNNAGFSSQAEIAASGNNVYVVWVDSGPGNFNVDVFFKRSTDRGDDFDRTKNLSNNAGGSFRPHVAAYGNNVYVVWEDNTPGNFDVFFKRSTDRGDDFDRTKNLSNNAGTSAEVEEGTGPLIAVSGNNVYVAWEDNTPGNFGVNFDILFKRSTDGGKTFGSTKNLSNNASFSLQSEIAASGNNVYVVWADNSDILFKRSTDGGKTFGSTKNLSNNAGNSRSPQIAASGNNVYVVWSDRTPDNFDILFKRSTDRGDDFDRTKNLSNNAGDSSNPQIAASGNNVYVVWQDNTPGNADVFFKRGTQ